MKTEAFDQDKTLSANSIENLASGIFDTGRRGEPLLGCDCITCFGYCMVDHDMRLREIGYRKTERSDDA